MSENIEYMEIINNLDTGAIKIFTAFNSILFYIIPSAKNFFSKIILHD